MSPLGVTLHPVLAIVAAILIVLTSVNRVSLRPSTPLLAIAGSYTVSLLAAARFLESIWLVPAMFFGVALMDMLAQSLRAEDRQPLLFGVSLLSALLALLALFDVFWLGMPRATAIFFHANLLGAVALIAACSLIIGAWSLPKVWQRSVVGSAGLAALLTVALSGSRGATAGMLLGLVIGGVLALMRKRFSFKLIVAIMTVVTISLVSITLLFGARLPIQARFDQTADFFDPSDRLYLWSVGREMLAERPLLGFGHDAWRNYVSAFEPFIQASRVVHPHSFYLDVALDSGFFGLVVLFWVLAGFTARLIRARSHLGLWFPVAVSVTVGLLAVNATDVLLSQLPVLLLWWLLLNTSLAATGPEGEGAAPPDSGAARAFRTNYSAHT